MAKATYITDVTGKRDNWRVNVLVVEKSNVYTNDIGRRLQKLMLLDGQGNRVEGVLWGSNMNVLEESLKPFTTYIIGGALVQPIQPGFQYATPGITVQWVMSRGTYIRPVNDDAEKIPYPAIEEVPFADIPAMADTGSPIDIVAEVTNVKEPRLVDVRGRLTPIRECTVVQEELRPLMLTLWGDFVEHQGAELFTFRNEMPIILCKGLRAPSFAGVSLSTIPFSFINLEPTIPEVTRLRNWLDTYLEDVQAIATRPPRNNLEITLANYEESQLTKLSDILPDSQAARCAVTMAIVDIHQKFAYTTCPKCKQTQKALCAETFPCHTCKEEQIADPRCKVVVQITDQSRTIDATLFDKCAERLLDHTAKEIHAMNNQEMAKHLQEISRTLGSEQIIAQIRAMKKKYNDKLTRYTIQEWIKKKTESSKAAESSNQGESATPAKELQTSAPTSTKDSPSKKTKVGSNTDDVPPSETNTTPMKKLKLKSSQED